MFWFYTLYEYKKILLQISYYYLDSHLWKTLESEEVNNTVRTEFNNKALVS